MFGETDSGMVVLGNKKLNSYRGEKVKVLYIKPKIKKVVVKHNFNHLNQYSDE